MIWINVRTGKLMACNHIVPPHVGYVDLTAHQLRMVQHVQCPHCGGKHVPALCIGNDECVHGPAGGPSWCCEKWGDRCCRCGASYARGQM